MASLGFDIFSLNTAGLRDYVKHCKVFNYMKKQTSPKDIIFFRETRSINKIEGLWTKQFVCGKGSIIFSHGKSDARGILIAFHEGFKCKIIEKHIDSDGRNVALNVLIDNNPLILANYCASYEEQDQSKSLTSLIIFSISCKLKRMLGLYGEMILILMWFSILCLMLMEFDQSLN